MRRRNPTPPSAFPGSGRNPSCRLRWRRGAFLSPRPEGSMLSGCRPAAPSKPGRPGAATILSPCRALLPICRSGVISRARR